MGRLSNSFKQPLRAKATYTDGMFETQSDPTHPDFDLEAEIDMANRHGNSPGEAAIRCLHDNGAPAFYVDESDELIREWPDGRKEIITLKFNDSTNSLEITVVRTV